MSRGGLSLLGVGLGPLIGALGIGGVALAFAAQAILANFLGGHLRPAGARRRRRFLPFPQGSFTSPPQPAVEHPIGSFWLTPATSRYMLVRKHEGGRAIEPVPSIPTIGTYPDPSGGRSALALAGAVPADAPTEGRRVCAPYSVWRRMVLAEAAQTEVDLMQASLCGSPYADLPGYDFPTYLEKANVEVATARHATSHDWPKGPIRKLGHAFHDILRVWSGSEHETAMAALHRAEGLLLMVAPDSKLQSEALKIEANFKSTSDMPASDPRRTAYPAVFARIKGWSANSHRDPATEVGDRVMLREIRRDQNEEWEIARCKVRIFRNILSVTIPIVAGILIVAAVIAWANPSLISLRASTATPDATDVAVVEFLGGLGGLLSAVATLRSSRNFQRFYGLPLAQSILKLPAGAASALVGILLVQHGLLGSIGPLTWDSALSYALVFGIAQVAVTKQIDSRAGDLLGEANAKSPTRTLSSSGSRSGSGE